MKDYYEFNDHRTKLEGDVKLNRIYAAKVDDEWQRVKVVDVQGDLVSTYENIFPFTFSTLNVLLYS